LKVIRFILLVLPILLEVYIVTSAVETGDAVEFPSKIFLDKIG